MLRNLLSSDSVPAGPTPQLVFGPAGHHSTTSVLESTISKRRAVGSPPSDRELAKREREGEEAYINQYIERFILQTFRSIS